MRKIRVAVLDLYDGHPNQGMRGFADILNRFRDEEEPGLQHTVFDVRGKREIAEENDFDLFISSGGPGSPLESIGSDWEKNYFDLMEAIGAHNTKNPDRKKHVLFVCHSFQLWCRHLQFGLVNQRRSTSFGILPVHMTAQGKQEQVFSGLEDPFFAVDSRDWQVIQPDEKMMGEKGMHILAIEKERPHVDLERCLMAIRFSDAFFGTQFHPEADAQGMKIHLLKPDKKESVIAEHGEEKYNEMLARLEDPDKIMLTQRTVIPNFLEAAVASRFHP